MIQKKLDVKFTKDYNVPSKWQYKYFHKNACPYNAR